MKNLAFDTTITLEHDDESYTFSVNVRADGTTSVGLQKHGPAHHVHFDDGEFWQLVASLIEKVRSDLIRNKRMFDGSARGTQ